MQAQFKMQIVGYSQVLYEEVYEVDERVIIYDGIEKGKEVRTATNGKKVSPLPPSHELSPAVSVLQGRKGWDM